MGGCLEQPLVPFEAGVELQYINKTACAGGVEGPRRIHRRPGEVQRRGCEDANSQQGKGNYRVEPCRDTVWPVQPREMEEIARGEQHTQTRGSRA